MGRPQDITFQRPEEVSRGRPQDVGRGRPLALHRGPVGTTIWGRTYGDVHMGTYIGTSFGDVFSTSSGRNLAEWVESDS